MLGKSLLAGAGLLILVYAALVALLQARQRDLIYFPGATQVQADTTNFSLDRQGVTLRGWRVNPGQPRVLIYFGGNAERVEQAAAELAAHFPDHTLYLLAYRGYGASDGKPTEADLFGDALALYDHIRARQPQAEISVIGRSLGSGVAAYLASRRPIRRLVLVTPFDSLAKVAQAHYPMFPVRWLLRDRYESARYLSGYAGEVLVLRAGGDRVVLPANTDRLLAALPRHARVVDFPQADHNDIAQDPGYAKALAAFLD